MGMSCRIKQPPTTANQKKDPDSEAIKPKLHKNRKSKGKKVAITNSLHNT
jgi:hypothetical protein